MWVAVTQPTLHTSTMPTNAMPDAERLSLALDVHDRSQRRVIAKLTPPSEFVPDHRATVIGAGFEKHRYYVMDRFGRTPFEARVSGPFLTYADAEHDRSERNIADDCHVCVEMPYTFGCGGQNPR